MTRQQCRTLAQSRPERHRTPINGKRDMRLRRTKARKKREHRKKASTRAYRLRSENLRESEVGEVAMGPAPAWADILYFPRGTTRKFDRPN